MAGVGTVTPRAKRPRRESSGDRGLSATRAGACRGTRSQQREEEQGQRYRLRGRDPWDSVPCSPLVPVTPGKGRLAKLRLPRGMSQPGVCPPLPRGMRLVPTVPVLGRDVPRRTRSTPGCTLVLELEGTLLCSSLLADECQDATATVTTIFQRDAYEVRVKLRPHVQQFLESLSKTYEIVIFTTAKQDYAKKVLDVLDPKKKLIRHCLSQQDCLCACGCYWKDLTCLGRDLAKTVALDHTIQGITTQAANWILVPRWWGDPQDKELLHLIPVLGQLGHAREPPKL
nr:CTD small phosphatase-like protein 2-B isoform X2 [Columba livia]